MRLIGRWLLTDIFAEIKNRVPLRQAAEDYGIQVERNSKAHCPFHGEDKHPSMKLYPDRFMCFTCNEHGDVITLVAKLLGIPLLDAAKELNDRYALGLTIGRASNAAERQKQREEAQQRRQKQELKQAFREWKTYAWEVLSRYYRLLNHWRVRTAQPIRSGHTQPQLSGIHETGLYRVLSGHSGLRSGTGQNTFLHFALERGERDCKTTASA